MIGADAGPAGPPNGTRPLMLSIPLGPLALPTGPVILLLAIWTATLVSRLAAKPDFKSAAERIVWQAATFGLLAARIAHLAAHWPAYLDAPWSIIDLRDGGWSWPAGLVVALGWAIYGALSRPGAQRAVLTGAGVGVMIWAGATLSLWWIDRQQNSPRIPDIAVTSLKTGVVKPLAEVIGTRPSIVNYWATWCGPCRAEMPILAAAQRKYQQLAIIFLNQAENPERINAFLKQENLELDEVWIDADSRFGQAVGSIGLPTTLFYDQAGQRVNAHFGAISAAALQIEADSLLDAMPDDARNRR